MNAIELIAEDLFEKVRSRYTKLQMGDESGGVTVTPKDARFFDFDFTFEGMNLGRVSISINDTGNLKIFYGQGITENKDPAAQNTWYEFLREMRFFAKRRLLRFDTRDISKGNLDKTDFNYLAQNGQKDNDMNESAMYGSLKTSHRTIENTDLIIRHSEAIDPTKAGARSRKIKNLFIQNKEGERFKFPFNYLPGGRAMQRHVANGGYPHDDAGKKIIETCEEILKLSDFGRKVRHSTLNDDAHAIAEKAGSKLKKLRQHMDAMSKQKYYENWMESVVPESNGLIELDDATMESMKNTFTVNKFDESLSDIFPLLHSIMQEENELDLESYVGEVITLDGATPSAKSVASEELSFESWVDSVISENLTDAQIAELEPIIQAPMPVGANGEAEQTLAGIGIRNPALTSALRAFAAMPNGANGDAREILKNYLGQDAARLNWGEGESTPQTLPPVNTVPPESVSHDNETTAECACDQNNDEPDDRLIEPETKQNKMKDVAQLVMGFYDRDNGTWTRGEHGVVTHVKRQFSNEEGEGGEREAALAAKLIQHLNQKHTAHQEFAEMRRLAGLPIIEAKKPSAGLTKKEKSDTVKKAKAGGDIGKKGKGFDKVAKAAGGGEKGKKVAAAAMWKNIKK